MSRREFLLLKERGGNAQDEHTKASSLEDLRRRLEVSERTLLRYIERYSEFIGTDLGEEALKLDEEAAMKLEAVREMLKASSHARLEKILVDSAYRDRYLRPFFSEKDYITHGSRSEALEPSSGKASKPSKSFNRACSAASILGLISAGYTILRQEISRPKTIAECNKLGRKIDNIQQLQADTLQRLDDQPPHSARTDPLAIAVEAINQFEPGGDQYSRLGRALDMSLYRGGGKHARDPGSLAMASKIELRELYEYRMILTRSSAFAFLAFNDINETGEGFDQRTSESRYRSFFGRDIYVYACRHVLTYGEVLALCDPEGRFQETRGMSKIRQWLRIRAHNKGSWEV